MDSSSKRSKSRETTTDATYPMIFTNSCQEDLFSVISMTLGEQTMQGVQNIRSEFENTLSPVIPQATMKEMYVPSPKQSQPMNVYDNLWAELCNDNDNFQPGEDTSKDLFQPDESIPLNDTFKKVNGLEHTVAEGTSSTQLNLNSPERVNISIPPARVVISEASTSTAARRSLKRPAQELGGSMGVVNPILSSKHCPKSNLSISQNNPNLWPMEPNAWNHSRGINGTTVRLGAIDPQLSGSFGNSMFSNAIGNSLNQFQLQTLQVHPYGNASPLVDTSASASFGTSVAVNVGANASTGRIAGMNSTPVTLETMDLKGASFGNSMFPNAARNLVHQFHSPTFQVHPHGIVSSVGGSSATVGVGANASAGCILSRFIDPQLGASFDNSVFPNTTRNPLNHQFKSPNFPVHLNGSTSGTGGASRGAGTSCGATVDIDPLVSAHGSVADSGGINASAGGVALANASVSASINANVVSSAHIDANTTNRLASIDPQGPSRVGTSFINSIIPNTTGKSPPQFQSCSSSSLSFQVHPFGSGSASVGASSGVNGSKYSSGGSGHQQFQRYHQYQMAEINEQGVFATMSQYNKGLFGLRPPTLEEFDNFVDAWEGFLIGRIYSYRGSLNRAKVVRKPTSPATLTTWWGRRLDVVLFVPTKAINYTMKVCGGPIDYVFLHITHFNNLDLYDQMTSKNMCAKIELPSQTLILSTTNNKHYYLGSVFPGDIIFVEPVELKKPQAMNKRFKELQARRA